MKIKSIYFILIPGYSILFTMQISLVYLSNPHDSIYLDFIHFLIPNLPLIYILSSLFYSFIFSGILYAGDDWLISLLNLIFIFDWLLAGVFYYACDSA